MCTPRFFFLLFPAITWATFISTAQDKSSLDPKDFETAIHQQGTQILDVRTLAEYHSGHLKNALLADWTNQAEFKERVAHLDKAKPVYTYCLSGVRSQKAAEWLQTNGFTRVYNLKGGIVAWKKADMPLEDQREVKQVTLEEYLSSIPAEKTVLVDVGADWCPPCKKMEPVLESLTASKELSFTLLRIDGGEQVELVKQLNIDAFPTLIIYKKGKEVWRKTGIADRSELTKQLQ